MFGTKYRQSGRCRLGLEPNNVLDKLYDEPLYVTLEAMSEYSKMEKVKAKFQLMMGGW